MINAGWVSNWEGDVRFLESSGDVDPNDPNTRLRGKGEMTVGNGLAIMYRSPRLYIENPDGEGWEDVEMTAYGRLVSEGELDSYSGLTMVARSNHDEYSKKGCEASGYYSRIYFETGECAFQKEYYHGSSNANPSGTIYSGSKRVPCFDGGLPLNEWVGMKFKVWTTPGTEDVNLELWLDYNDDGMWTKVHSMVDTPGAWLKTGSTEIPKECPHQNGDTVTRPGNVCFLRTDGDWNTEVHWKNASITNYLSASTSPPTTASPTSMPSSHPKCNGGY